MENANSPETESGDCSGSSTSFGSSLCSIQDDKIQLIDGVPILNGDPYYEGYIYKWTNYANGYRRRWFVLNRGTLSYYKSRDEDLELSRGTIPVVSSRIYLSSHDKLKFDIVSGSGSKMVSYHLKGEHVEAVNNWVLALYQAKHIELKRLETERHFVSLSHLEEQDESENDSAEEIEFQEHLSRVQSAINDFESQREVMQLTRQFRDFLDCTKRREIGWTRRVANLEHKLSDMEEALEQLVAERNQLELLVQKEETNKIELRQILEQISLEHEDLNLTSKVAVCLKYLDVPEEKFFDAIEVVGDASPEDQASYGGDHGFWKPEALGYPKHRRTRLPCDSVVDASNVSIWTVLKSTIGKDLTRISVPIHYNEPVSLLQRLAEDMEYSDLLDRASHSKDPLVRIQCVAAFAVASYASTEHRVSKPFNPLLHETFEYVSEGKGIRYIAEQVSHHPPISACHCEGANWIYWGEMKVKTRFWGRSLEVIPEGACNLVIKTSGERYSWTKVNTLVNNIVFGKLWIDHYGVLDVVNHGTGNRCSLEFKQSNWRGAGSRKIEGTVMDSSEQILYEMYGKWDQFLRSRRLENNAEELVWRANKRPTYSPHMYNFTYFTMTLNELDKELARHLCPTDSRFRPDQRAMENGKLELGIRYKEQLENRQRLTRKQKEACGDLEESPRWFSRVINESTGDTHWAFKGTYWKQRETRNWDGIPQIYLE